ncbi:hypothetical protein UPYG_G00315410 [Umbra pygmaea]|uniref:Uncharacterized protein n=1 Tax=Umbra pygmaea TaxID=75934 RepID=A0ABD0VZQ8_UMBPY
MSFFGGRERCSSSKRRLQEEHATNIKVRRVQQERPESSDVSCVSINSKHAMGGLSNEKRVQQERPVSPILSCVSLKGDRSMGNPLDFRERDFSNEPRNPLDQSESEKPSGHPAQQMDMTSIFRLFEEKSLNYLKSELKKLWGILSSDPTGCVERQGLIDVGAQMQHSSSASEGAMKIAMYILKTMNQNGLADALEKGYYGKLAVCQHKLKLNLKRRCECVFEGIAKQGNPTPLNKIFTELYITEGGSGEVNNEHEVRQIETATKKTGLQEIPIKCNDIFRQSPGQEKRIRTVLTKGIAGIGKTISVQKFLLDWAEGKSNQDVELIISLPFRELNMMEENMSLMELLHHFCIETKESGVSYFDKYKMVLVFDGLDECRIPLDFQNNKSLCDVEESTTVDVLLTNLIKGNLLPSAHIWVTSRPAAAHRVPPECVDQVTEVRGFNNPQKEEYFIKKTNDLYQARKLITHMKSSRSLYIMCHIPVFCWISATVLTSLLTEAESGKLPKTLTQMYSHFLVFQINQMILKYIQEQQMEPTFNENMILTLGKLAFQQLQKGNLIFYEEDLKECGIDVRDASVYSGVCTQVFRQESWLFQKKIFCFVHLSIQEFLAALYVFHMFTNNKVNLMAEQESTTNEPKTSTEISATILYKSAVDKALLSENGHLDLFLRFLLGLSLKSNQTLLQGLLARREGVSEHHTETIEYIKEKIRENPSPEKCINLFHCLNELNDHSLVEEVQSFLSSGRFSENMLSPVQWSALVFALLTSEDELDVFDLRKYSKSEEGLLRLLPVILASRTALLIGCNLTENCCEALASTLTSQTSHLRVLDLSDNCLQDSGFELLSVGLRDPHCKLEKLRLNRCYLTKNCCEALASSLSSNSSSLKELDLSDNDIEDSGVKLLSAGLASPHCKLETLRLTFCGVTVESCAYLVSALRSNPSHLSELELNYNYPGIIGVKMLTAAIEDPLCKLQKLGVNQNAERWVKSGLKKYTCELTLDTNTVHKRLSLSEGNRKIALGRRKHPYPDHADRFDHWMQVLFKEGLTGRSYWEAEWSDEAFIAVTYKKIRRKGVANECVLGNNDVSWGLHCSTQGYVSYPIVKGTAISVPSANSRRVGVYLDWPAGTLSFYRVTSGSLTHLHTFYTTFTEPLYPGFRLWIYDSSVALCHLK